MEIKTVEETGCCPRFDPAPWDNKTFTWKDKAFVRDTVSCLFHIPLNFGTVIPRMWDKVKKAGADPDVKEWLVLSDAISPWKSVQYMTVTREVPGMDNVKFSGTFLSKVFEGPFKDAPKWCEQLNAHVESQGKKPIKTYFYYTTCPKCAKAYGKNYVVGFAEV